MNPILKSPKHFDTVATYTLFRKEILRFWKVAFQTIVAPVLTALLYLIIFAQALEERVNVYEGISYTAFLVPGLIMMSILQNAFANSSSSLIQSKVMGNMVFMLLPPIAHWEFFVAYIGASIVRGISVGIGVAIGTVWFTGLPIHNIVWVITFALLGGAILGSLGLIAGVWAEKFDQIAMFQNFIIMPATFLSGVFYSIKSLSPFWQTVSHLNPLFYLIDGFRYGFFARSDSDPWFNLMVAVIALLLCSGIALQMLRTSYKLRH
jgi:ABC-2 type transport system permease protein